MKERLLFLLILGALSASLLAQNKSSFDPDSLFQEAREKAFSGERGMARSLCDQVIFNYPTYVDAYVLKGRTYAWDKHYDSARTEIQKALSLKPSYTDALRACIDNEKWSGNYGRAMGCCDKALLKNPRDIDFMVLKSELLIKTGQEKEAARWLTKILDIDPSNEDATSLIDKIKDARIHNQFRFSYSFEFFDQPWTRRWSMTTIGYSRKTVIGSIIGKVNISDLVKDHESLYGAESELQYELEAYPKVADGRYLYVAYAFAPANLFPRHRAGVEIYQGLPHSFEASLGGRWLMFDKDNEADKHVYIFTASVGYYYKNYWFSLRPYIVPKEKGSSQSMQLEIRRYFKSANQYLSLIVGVGSSPDDPADISADYEVYKLQKQKARVSYQSWLAKKLLSEIYLGYENEEFVAEKVRDNWKTGFKLYIYF